MFLKRLAYQVDEIPRKIINEIDNTVEKGELPQTGFNSIILISILGVGIVAVIIYIKIKKKSI